ncbi:DUF2993 domain-containing protein [uncultured Corynebacterium sp.]|uniref:LmeA family phospholipid-binding protein n=1 Tax=uncultured Corynebacterium sp. TaxID=159447 RepID=UPI0025FD9A6C|nr:DUF2993 domain-containing protein [uncultured Corynebacterium sp.]
MAAKNSAASKAWKIIVGILVGLLILILIAEFGLRWFMASQMTKQFESEGGGKAEVSFGSSPMLLGLAQGSLPEMNVSTESTLRIDGENISGQPAADIHIEDMSVSGDPVAGHLTTSTTLPDDYLLATLQKGIADKAGNDTLGDVVITDLVANQASGDVSVEFAGGLFSLTLVPEAKDGRLAFTATSSKILAWNLPDEVTSKISETLTNGMQDQLTTGDMTMDSVTVGDGEISLTMSGNNVNLNELNTQFGGTTDTEGNTDSAPADQSAASNA